MKLGTKLSRLYHTLNVGQFVFVEDDFEFGASLAEVIYDLTRMDSNDRDCLIKEIPNATASKAALQQYADYVKTHGNLSEIKNLASEDIAFAFPDYIKRHPDLDERYTCIKEDLLSEECKSIFLKYGVGLSIPRIFQKFFDEVIRYEQSYKPTRVFGQYIEDVRIEILRDIRQFGERTGKGTALVLDNIISGEKKAEQMVEDLIAFNEESSARVLATIFSTANQASEKESCQKENLYISYAKKEEGFAGVHKCMVHAAINILMQGSKKKLIEVIEKNCNMLAINPSLVEYLYCMAALEGAPGYEVIEQWLSFMNSSEVRKSKEFEQLIGLSTCIDAYHFDSFDCITPALLSETASTEFFSNEINRYYTVTSPGDIFECNGSLYVLVGQECDYMMGEKRTRNNPLCELVSAEVVFDSNYEKLSSNQDCIFISNFKTQTGQLATLKVNYSKRKFIRNEIINLCSFNCDGACSINCREPLPEKCMRLIQPYLIDYYEELQKMYLRLQEIQEKCDDVKDVFEGLKVSSHLLDYFSYEKSGNIISFPIRRYSHIKERPSLYINKMYLEYRGRIPYTSIHLLGYETLPITLVINGKPEKISVYVHQTANRNKNSRNDRRKLVWLVSYSDLEQALKRRDSEYTLPEELCTDGYYRLVKDSQTEKSSHFTFAFRKRYEDNSHFIDLQIERKEAGVVV